MSNSIDLSMTGQESVTTDLFESARAEQEKMLQFRKLKQLLQKKDVRKTITYMRYDKNGDPKLRSSIDTDRSSGNANILRSSSGYLSNFTIDVSKLEKQAVKK